MLGRLAGRDPAARGRRRRRGRALAALLGAAGASCRGALCVRAQRGHVVALIAGLAGAGMRRKASVPGVRNSNAIGGRSRAFLLTCGGRAARAAGHALAKGARGRGGAARRAIAGQACRARDGAAEVVRDADILCSVLSSDPGEPDGKRCCSCSFALCGSCKAISQQARVTLTVHGCHNSRSPRGSRAP